MSPHLVILENKTSPPEVKTIIHEIHVRRPSKLSSTRDPSFRQEKLQASRNPAMLSVHNNMANKDLNKDLLAPQNRPQ
jgi:hypothetical protein